MVEKGQSLTFELAAADAAREEWHSLTSCAAPCNRSTGIAYPIPDGKWQFDSGQLGLTESRPRPFCAAPGRPRTTSRSAPTPTSAASTR